jgi:hypothetical protein
MDEFKQAPGRPSSPMFNYRLTVAILGRKLPWNRGCGGQKIPGMIAACGTCCRKDTVDEDFARVVELERLARRAQAMGLGQWLSLGG